MASRGAVAGCTCVEVGQECILTIFVRLGADERFRGSDTLVAARRYERPGVGLGQVCPGGTNIGIVGRSSVRL